MPQSVEPTRLILDGQQRMTSLFQALSTPEPVETFDFRRTPVKRWFYIDIAKILDPNIDREDAIVVVPEDRTLKGPGGKITLDLSTVANECAAGMIPIHVIFNPAVQIAWQTEFFQPDDHAIMPSRFRQWLGLAKDVFPLFLNYQVPVIMLRKDTPKEAVC